MPSSSARNLALPVLLACATLVAAAAGATVRTAFVTSVSGTGNLSSWADAGGHTGLAAGDAICQARAAAAGLPNAAAFRAWLSTTTVDAFCHVLGLNGTKADDCNGGVVGDPPAGPWARTDGQPFAAKLADLADETGVQVFQPLRFDENGAEVPFVDAFAWAATGANGRVFSTTCVDWTSASGAVVAGCGNAGGVGLYWTYYISLGCDAAHRLICLESAVGEVQRVPSTEGALAFLTSVTGNGDLASWADSGGTAGLAGADAVCRARAAAAHLPDVDRFHAWMSDSTADAIDRVWFLGPWVRLDGFPLAVTRAEMLGTTGALLTGLNVDDAGAYVTGTLGEDKSWTGTQYTGQATTDNCADWSSSLGSDLGTGGDFDTARYFTWQSGGSPYCVQLHRLYCLSNQAMLFWDNFERGDTLKWSAAAQ
jgi:hypothetical protein